MDTPETTTLNFLIKLCYFLKSPGITAGAFPFQYINVPTIFFLITDHSLLINHYSFNVVYLTRLILLLLKTSFVQVSDTTMMP